MQVVLPFVHTSHFIKILLILLVLVACLHVVKSYLTYMFSQGLDSCTMAIHFHAHFQVRTWKDILTQLSCFKSSTLVVLHELINVDQPEFFVTNPQAPLRKATMGFSHCARGPRVPSCWLSRRIDSSRSAMARVAAAALVTAGLGLCFVAPAPGRPRALGLRGAGASSGTGGSAAASNWTPLGDLAELPVGSSMVKPSEEWVGDGRWKF